MTASNVLLAIRHLARDTFRQSIASGICWVMLGVSALCIVVCLSVRVENDQLLPSRSIDPVERAEPSFMPNEAGGKISLAFGAIPVKIGRDRIDAIHFLQIVLAGFVADSVGLLLVLLWTSGFLPSFLEPGSAAVLLAKPIPRWSLLTGKYLGVLTFVGIQATIFVFGTWVALGLATGVWEPNYLLCIPILILHFSVFYSFSAFLAVYLRNAVTCMFGTVIFWMMCLGMNFARHRMIARPEFQEVSPGFRFLVEAGYWILPKPADFAMLLSNALQAEDAMGTLDVFENVQKMNALYLDMSVVSSLAFAVVVLGMAAYEFMTIDY